MIVWAAYNSLVHKPMMRMFAERHERTAGAITRAQADIASANAKAADYEEKLRLARLELFKQQEARRKQLVDMRAQAVAEARAQAEKRVQAAKAELGAESESAKSALNQQAEKLADDVVRAVLRPSQPAAGAR